MASVLRNPRAWLLLGAAVLPLGGARAADLIAVKRLSVEMARDIADAALHACRQRGYQVSAVAVERTAVPQVVMRDNLAPRFTLKIAEDKANAVILSGVDSGTFRANREDIRQEMNQVEGILVLDRGVAIRAAGSLVGAVGVSGAPGGDKDAACARAGIAAVRDRLDFAQ